MNETAQSVSDQINLKTREEAADLLRVHVATVDRLTRRQKLRPVRVGGRVLFEAAELARYVREARA